MKIDVDQSGKVEQLNCDTVLAFSNSEQYAVLLPKSLKRRIFLYYRSRTKQLRYKLFTICLYYCLKDYLRHLTLIMVDCEYQGKEQLIMSEFSTSLRLVAELTVLPNSIEENSEH